LERLHDPVAREWPAIAEHVNDSLPGLASMITSLSRMPATSPRAIQPKSNDRRYGGRFVLNGEVWWATLGSNQ
jgi:hypothetical protein